MNIIENIQKTVVPEMDWNTEKNISYTQLSAWMECPHRWKQMYIDKIKQPPSIHLSFGTAMHETLQEYMELMYNKGQQHADEFDAHADFQERFLALYKADVDKKGEHFATQKELIEFTNDGLNIIDFFLRHRQEHFQKHGWKLLGIEMPVLLAPHEDYPNVKLALTGLWFRLNDKIQRLRQLVVNGEPDTVGESVQDTFQDMSVYGIIAQLVQQKKFK